MNGVDLYMLSSGDTLLDMNSLLTNTYYTNYIMNSITDVIGGNSFCLSSSPVITRVVLPTPGVLFVCVYVHVYMCTAYVCTCMLCVVL